MKDAIFELARNVVRTRYEDLPEAAVIAAKMFVIDTFGVGLAGSSASGCAEVVQLIKEQGGASDSSILVYGGKVPAQEAAFANSMMIHALDFDDSHEGQVGAHCNVTVLPAAFAVAEKNGATGAEFLAAVVLGIDLMAQLGNVAPLYQGWHNSATLGVFGAAAAAGKMLGLDEDKMVHALGIAFSQAAGTRQARADGALTKRMQPAFAAKAGVFSAFLAERGLTGAHNIVEGPWGLFGVYGQNRIKPDGPALKQWRQESGKKYQILELSAKLYPCCRMSHGAIDATLALLQERQLKDTDIQEVTVKTSAEIHEAAGHPFKIRDNPQVDAQFSIPYAIAVAIQRRNVVLNDFKEDVVRDSRSAELARKVSVEVDRNLPKWSTVVNLRTRDGRSFSKRVDIMKGHPSNPLSSEEFLQKFRECARFSGHSESTECVERLLACLRNIEAADNLNQLAELMA